MTVRIEKSEQSVTIHGVAFHPWVLSRERFNQMICTEPYFSRATTEEGTPGRIIVVYLGNPYVREDFFGILSYEQWLELRDAVGPVE